MNILHGVPPESAHIQRLRAELAECRTRVTRDLALLDAQMQAVDVGFLLLSGSLKRLDQALTDTANALGEEPV